MFDIIKKMLTSNMSTSKESSIKCYSIRLNKIHQFMMEIEEYVQYYLIFLKNTLVKM